MFVLLHFEQQTTSAYSESGDGSGVWNVKSAITTNLATSFESSRSNRSVDLLRFKILYLYHLLSPNQLGARPEPQVAPSHHRHKSLAFYWLKTSKPRARKSLRAPRSRVQPQTPVSSTLAFRLSWKQPNHLEYVYLHFCMVTSVYKGYCFLTSTN